MSGVPGSPRRSFALMGFAMAVIGISIAGLLGWRVHLRLLKQQIEDKQGALKKMLLLHQIPPNQKVMEYLGFRQAWIEEHHNRLLKLALAEQPATVSGTDLQLYFQQQGHDIQRAIERLAIARSLSVPAILGLPKELPPSDSVPRLLAQLYLVQQMTDLVFEQGITKLASLKLEDPGLIPEENTDSTVWMRLPVRVRCYSSLTQLVKMLGAIQYLKPLADLRNLRILSSSATGDELEIELLLCRYFFIAQQPMTAAPIQDSHPSLTSAKDKGSSPSGNTPSRQRRKESEE